MLKRELHRTASEHSVLFPRGSERFSGTMKLQKKILAGRSLFNVYEHTVQTTFPTYGDKNPVSKYTCITMHALKSPNLNTFLNFHHLTLTVIGFNDKRLVQIKQSQKPSNT